MKVQMTKPFSWDERRHDAKLILDRILKARRNHGGKISFNAAPYEMWLPVLLSAVRATPEAKDYKSQCVRSALSDASLTLTNLDAFLKRCAAEFHKLSRKPRSRYILVGSITYSGPKLFSSVSDGMARIEWCESLESDFLKRVLIARQSVQHRLVNLGIPSPSKGLTTMKVHVEASNPRVAALRALDSLDKVRSLLNLLINQSRSVSMFTALTGTPHAVNQVRQGPYFTLHHMDGTLATETIWREPRWDHHFKDRTFSKPEKTGAEIRKWLKRIPKSPLGDHISQGLLRYCRALDSHDHDTSLLALWGVIEHLTLTQEVARNDLAIKRLQQVFDDPEEIKELAEHVRQRRNRMAHAAVSPETGEADMVIFHADILVRGLLLFWLNHGRHFEKKEDVAQFLDLPRDREQLDRQVRHIRRFISYQWP
jgi:hypothetical protein